ncbi:MAG: nucleoside transporter C-terminal domain-containing protein [Myxococcota bacterium]|nr:nucleoside transporter C-terminal domain-containing protein [Myxococcota bacterium]
MSDLSLRAVSAMGFFVMIGLAWLASSDRRAFPLRVVLWGIGLQFALAVVLLRTQLGRGFFEVVNTGVNRFLLYADEGTRFVFGPLMDTGFSFALNVLPLIIFMGSFFAVLYHLGLVQRVVEALAWLLARTMRLSGAESLAAVANIFVGMIESSLVVKPYLARMTQSELFTLMSLGMATVAGSVLLSYVSILGGGDFAGHLVTASLLSAPAGLLVAKVMLPEKERPVTAQTAGTQIGADSVNVIDAAATGALNGLRLAAYVGTMLVAFVALIAFSNDLLSSFGALAGVPDLTLQKILGWLMAPFAWLMGIPWEDARSVGSMLGMKTILNEFIAYQELGRAIQAGEISERAAIVASYALCGFANLGSLAILLGGIGGIAPKRRQDVARLGMRSILAGTLATMMTGCMAGMLL